MIEREKIARHAYLTVPYYKELFARNGIEAEKFDFLNDWESIPLVEKEMVILHPSKLISEQYLGELVTGKLKRMHTSGTTGTCLEIYWNNVDYIKSLIPLWLQRWEHGRIKTRDRVCFFGTIYNSETEYEYYKNSLIIAKTELTQDKIRYSLRKMQEFRPDWLLIQPSVALLLCEAIEKEEELLPASLRYIELTGEMILPSWKSYIQRVFQCVVRCHYGTMEVSTIGYEEGKDYKLLEDATYVEILDREGRVQPNGVEGDIYVTSLHNYAMPFVRYPTGDRGCLWVSRSGAKYLTLNLARNNDRFIYQGGEMAPDFLLQPIELLNLIYDNIVYQVQIKQLKRNQLEIHVVLDEDYSRKEFVQFYLQHLKKVWREELMFEFVFEDRIMRKNETGKLRWFVSGLEK